VFAALGASMENLLPIVLSARRQTWRAAPGHGGELDKRFAPVRAEILRRDDYTCRFCGFRAPRFHEGHHLDDNHANLAPENLVTACCLCHQCHHLGMAGLRQGGRIIWLPEISQADLHHLCRAIWVAIAQKGKHAKPAHDVKELLEARSSAVDQELGPGASSPLAIGQALLDMKPDQYQCRAQRFAGLRLLPESAAFAPQIKYWASDPAVYGSLAADDWDRIAAPILSAQASAADAASVSDDEMAPEELEPEPIAEESS
jgi:intracellular multiplication protein IcmJ